MGVPPEVRLHLYKVMFGSQKQIPLVIDKNGLITYQKEAKLSLQMLRTCRTIYQEAIPVLYGINEWMLKEGDLKSLAYFAISGRRCIDNVVLLCDLTRTVLATVKSLHEDRSSMGTN